MNVVLAGISGGWEIMVVSAFVLILCSFKILPKLARGCELGFSEFNKACLDVADEIQKNL